MIISTAGDDAGTTAGETAGTMMVTQCSDGEDNDNDELIDLNDPGCADEADNDESDDPEPTACFDRDLINLRAVLTNFDYVDLDLSTFGMSETWVVAVVMLVLKLLGNTRLLNHLQVSLTTDFPETVVPVVMYVRDSCEGARDVDGDDYACNRGSSTPPGTQVELLDVEPGTYYLFIDTSSPKLVWSFPLKCHY